MEGILLTNGKDPTYPVFELKNYPEIRDLEYSHLTKKEREAKIEPIRTEPKETNHALVEVAKNIKNVVEMENLCETCKLFKPRNTVNCQIQQQLHSKDIINETISIIIKCEKYVKIREK